MLISTAFAAIWTDDRRGHIAELHDDIKHVELHDDDQTRSSLDFGVGHTSLRSG